MEQVNLSSGWRQWLRPNRLIPLLTILSAGVAIVLSLLNIIQLTVAEQIVIALLALLAVDALTERLSVLEKIEAKLEEIEAELEDLPALQALRSRDVLPSIENQAAQASEICIAAVSAVSLSHHAGFYRSKIAGGCKIRVILLDPQGQSLQTWELQNKKPTAAGDIKGTLMGFEDLVKMKATEGGCEVRLSKVFLPYSVVAVDMNKKSGSMIVEFHAYKRLVDERPHVFLTPTQNSKWFNFYREQFEEAWSQAVVWAPPP